MPARFNRRYSTGLLLTVFMGLAVGCASLHPNLKESVSIMGAEPAIELSSTPFFPQKTLQCGPAALATVLGASGVSVTPDELTSKVYLPGRDGSLQLELIAATRRYGRLPYPIDGGLTDIIAQLLEQRPVLVMQNLGLESYPAWHYAVVIGFDANNEQLVLRSGERERHFMSTRAFMRSWSLADNWALVMLAPGELPPDTVESRYVNAVSALENVAVAQDVQSFYEAGLERWPSNQLAHFGLANSQFFAGDLDAAETTYQKLLAMNPDFVAARNNLAFVLAQRGCQRLALHHLGLGFESVSEDDPLYVQLQETQRDILNRADTVSPQEESGHCTEAALTDE
tara:strand:+ start:104079 stop:105101 length:1023 start_codon:yes stop_codon:yes gene_type:complete